jgi:hypothetical protein
MHSDQTVRLKKHGWVVIVRKVWRIVNHVTFVGEGTSTILAFAEA